MSQHDAMPAADEWMMGGSKNAAANAALGVSEADVAAMAVEAYEYAWAKVGAAEVSSALGRIAYEMASEFQMLLCERLGVEITDET